MSVSCRLCGQGKEDSKTSQILNNRAYPNLSVIITRRVGIVIHEDDNFPKKVCEACMEKVVSFDVFANRCAQIQLQLFSQPNENFRMPKLPISCIPFHNKPPQINTPRSIKKEAAKISSEKRSVYITQRKDKQILSATNKSNHPSIEVATHVITNPKAQISVPGNKPKKCSIEVLHIDNSTTKDKKSIQCGSIQIELSDEIEISTTDVSTESSNNTIQIVEIDSDKGDAEEDVELEPIRSPAPVPFNIRRAIPDVCPYCNAKMDANSCLNKHIRDLHPGKEIMYRCAVCDRNFQTKNGLDRHKDTHSELPRFCCELCGKLFKSHTSFCNHKKIHDPSSYRFTCSYNNCARVFNNKSSYAEHARIHTGESPYACDECQSTFRTKNQLNNHKWIHADIRNYECHICHRKFRHNSHLKVHIKRHKGQKDLRCEVCGKSFVNNYDLTRHNRTHTGERPFQCHLCSRALIDSGTYKKHMKMHEDYMAVLDDDDDDININMNPEDEDTLNEVQIRIDPLEDDSTMDMSCSELLQIGASALAMKENERKNGKDGGTNESNDDAAVLHSIEQTVKSTLEGKSFEDIIQKDHDYIEIVLDTDIQNPESIKNEKC